MINFLLYTTVVLIWGTTWYVITLHLAQVDPAFSVAYRFGLASLLLFAFCLVRRLNLRFSIRDHLFMALQGLTLFAASYQLVYLASRYLTSGMVAVVFSTIMIMNVFNLRLFLGRQMQWSAVGAGALGLAGICLIFWTELAAFSISPSLAGALIVLAATYLASVGNIVSVRHGWAGIPVTQANAFGMGYGGAFMLLYGIIETGELQYSLSPDYLLPLLFLSVFGSIIVFGCYMALNYRMGADRAAYSNILAPVLALAVSTLFEGYQWALPAVLGVSLVSLGNVIVLVPVAQWQKLLSYRRSG